MVYSWILPIKDEAESLHKLLSEITMAMKDRIASDWEVIALDDASKDNTLTTLTSLASRSEQTSKIPQLKVIHFKTHQGKWAALRAGFDASKGKVIITSDSDLQDDPAEVHKLLKKLNLGFDLISGWRHLRYDPSYKVLISRLGNNLASLLTGKNYKDLNSPFKVYRREIIDNLPTQGSLLRFSMLFAKRLGYKVAEVPVLHRPRLYGKSKFGIVKYLRIIYDLILVLLLFRGSGRLTKN